VAHPLAKEVCVTLTLTVAPVAVWLVVPLLNKNQEGRAPVKSLSQSLDPMIPFLTKHDDDGLLGLTEDSFALHAGRDATSHTAHWTSLVPSLLTVLDFQYLPVKLHLGDGSCTYNTLAGDAVELTL
jgi:hypothetical protein